MREKARVLPFFLCFTCWTFYEHTYETWPDNEDRYVQCWHLQTFTPAGASGNWRYTPTSSVYLQLITHTHT